MLENIGKAVVRYSTKTVNLFAEGAHGIAPIPPAAISRALLEITTVGAGVVNIVVQTVYRRIVKTLSHDTEIYDALDRFLVKIRALAAQTVAISDSVGRRTAKIAAIPAQTV